MSEYDSFRAYPNQWHALETVMRVAGVKRWHLIDTSRTQTLAEHSANVALLAMVLIETCPVKDFFDDVGDVVPYALSHDLAEVLTGDIPTFTKKYIDGIGELEAFTTHPMWQMKPTSMTKLLVKMCDLADGIRFVWMHGTDRTGEHACNQLDERLHELFGVARANHWPVPVVDHMIQNLTFYMYERG